MIKGLRPVFQVLLAVLFMEAGLGILSPVVYTQLARQEVQSVLIGFVNSAYYIAFLAGTLTCHRIIDRVGHIRAYTVFAALAANAAIAHIVLLSPISWIILHGVLGYAFAGLAVIVESWLNDKATEDNRGTVFGTYMGVSWAASGLGPLALGYQESLGNSALFVFVTMFLITALVPMALTTVGNPDIEEREHLPLHRLFAASPTGVTACFGVGLASSAFYGLLPPYATSLKMTDGQLAWILSSCTIAGFIMQFPIGWLSDQIGRRPLIVASTGLSAVMAVVVAQSGISDFVPLLVLLIVLAAAMAPIYALGVGQTNDYITKDQFVAASAGLLFTWALGATAGPIIAGYLMDVHGPSALLWYTGAAMGGTCVFTLIRMLMRRALSPQEQGNYVPLPTTVSTHGALELDPRAEHKPHGKAAGVSRSGAASGVKPEESDP